MDIRKFTKSLHMEAMHRILAARGAYLPTEAETPQVGFIVYELETPIATAFLRMCEGGYAQIDGVATNPNCSSKQRHIAQETAIKACMETAKRLEIKQLFAFCSDTSTITRSERLGFVKLPHNLMAYDLKTKV